MKGIEFIMKKNIAIMIALCVMISIVAIFASPADDISNSGVVLQLDNKKAIVEGEQAVLDVPPMIIEGRTLLPLRFVAEKAAGATVKWDESTKTAVIIAGEKTITVTIGGKKIIVNGSETAIDVAAVVVEGRTLVPLRAIVSAIGKKVFWDEANKLIIITKDEITPDEASLAGLVDRIEGRVAIATKTPTATPTPTTPPRTTGIPTIVGKGKSLFKDTFDKLISSDAVVQDELNAAIVDKGQLTMNIGVKSWVAYGTADLYNPLKFKQLEMSVDISSVKTDADRGAWIGAIIGTRVSSPEAIPTVADGFWAVISDEITMKIYTSQEGVWPTGSCDVDIPVNFAKMRKVTVIDSGDKIVYYAKDDQGKDVILVRAEISGSEIKVFDTHGIEVYKGKHNLQPEGTFRIFAHFSEVKIDNFEIIGVE